MTDQVLYSSPTPSATFAGPVSIVNDPQSSTAASLAVQGGVTLNSGAGNTTIGGILVAQKPIAGGVLGTTAASITGGQTIASTGRVSRITGTGATSVAVATGTVDGQDLTIINLGVAVTLTTNMQATYTLATTAAIGLVWDAGSTAWFHKV